MNRKLLVVPAALASLAASPAFADALDYNYLQFGYVTTELEDEFVSVNGNGYSLEGSASINDNFHVFAGYGAIDFDFDVDTTEWELGLGYSRAVGEKTDLVATLGYVSAEVDMPFFGRLDDDGYSVGLGIRSMVTDRLELEGKVDYVDLSDSGSDTVVTVQLGYELTHTLLLGGGVTSVDGDNAYHVGLRVYFGK